jgi:hypothetical protein
MSPLVLIQQAAKRKQRLNQAQFLMAKAYRGVSYVSASGGISPVQLQSIKTYRGIAYTN